MAPVYGILLNDFNDDNLTDILLTGNSYAPDVLSGQYDAFKGLFLSGNGDGNFVPKTINQSGFLLDDDAKGIAAMADPTGDMIFSAVNDGYVKVWKNMSGIHMLIPIEQQDTHAILTLSDNKKVRKELYFGSSYLSQSSRSFTIPAEGVLKLEIYDNRGKSREIKIKH